MAKAVRMSDIAERLHVSIVTVSKALAGKDGVSEELRQEILQLAEEMGYKNKKAKPVAAAKTYTLGIVTSYRYIEKGQYVQHRVFFANEEIAIKAGYRPCAKCMPEEYKEWKNRK